MPRGSSRFTRPRGQKPRHSHTNRMFGASKAASNHATINGMMYFFHLCSLKSFINSKDYAHVLLAEANVETDA